MEQSKAQFFPGQVICHKLFDYRGVIVDVDAVFSGQEDWYEQVARSRPPKDAPWYHVLREDGQSMTYVAERNLDFDHDGPLTPSPALKALFSDYSEGRYQRKKQAN